MIILFFEQFFNDNTNNKGVMNERCYIYIQDDTNYMKNAQGN